MLGNCLYDGNRSLDISPNHRFHWGQMLGTSALAWTDPALFALLQICHCCSPWYCHLATAVHPYCPGQSLLYHHQPPHQDTCSSVQAVVSVYGYTMTLLGLL